METAQDEDARLRFDLRLVVSRILRDHRRLGPEKPMSYLPIKTIEQVVRITIPAYKVAVEQSGNQCIVLGADECCISSGAVYAYSESALSKILNESAELLREHSWPIVPADFVARVASEWLSEDAAVLPVVRKAFGELPRLATGDEAVSDGS